MRKSMNFVGITLAVFLFSSGSAWYGYWKGVEHGGALETTALGALSTAQIKRLKSGTPDDINAVIGFFEYYVDHGLNQYNWYDENGSKFWGNLLANDYEESLIRSAKLVAIYRAENPENTMIESIYPVDFAKRKQAVEKLTK
ncbi:hypothetical protein Q4561_13860 [Alteromonas sp. 1_MG-2023]|uniref:hypothetical protein n=1 Tax=Alteromonas sp. 1_MG-2023 TaxID=3062669 RepID=UPI0026E1DDFA|nr:hypothetical protein [Alteromonas sp. 1_MG-2023]MDO6568153.1 hypothetical protein [Alteromonas sp. 1_MG-2023]